MFNLIHKRGVCWSFIGARGGLLLGLGVVFYRGKHAYICHTCMLVFYRGTKWSFIGAQVVFYVGFKRSFIGAPEAIRILA